MRVRPPDRCRCTRTARRSPVNRCFTRDASAGWRVAAGHHRRRESGDGPPAPSGPWMALGVRSPEHPPPKSPVPQEPEPLLPGQPGIRLVYARAHVTRITREQAVATAVTQAVSTVARSGHCHAPSLPIFCPIRAVLLGAIAAFIVPR